MLKSSRSLSFSCFFLCGKVVNLVFLHCQNPGTMEKKTMKPLTRAEMEVMNELWDAPQALTVNEIVERYAEPQPAYTTVATFLKILEAKGYVEHRRKEGSGRTFYYSPMLSREKYITHVLNDVKDSLFGSSTKRLFSYLIQSEDLSDEDLHEIMEMINKS